MELLSEFEYECAKERLEQGEKHIIKRGGFQKAPKHWITEYMTIANAMLGYELEHDLIPELL